MTTRFCSWQAEQPAEMQHTTSKHVSPYDHFASCLFSVWPYPCFQAKHYYKIKSAITKIQLYHICKWSHFSYTSVTWRKILLQTHVYSVALGWVIPINTIGCLYVESRWRFSSFCGVCRAHSLLMTRLLLKQPWPIFTSYEYCSLVPCR